MNGRIIRLNKDNFEELKYPYNLFEVNNKIYDIEELMNSKRNFVFLFSLNGLRIGYCIINIEFIFHKNYDYFMKDFFIISEYHKNKNIIIFINLILERLKGNWEIDEHIVSSIPMSLWNEIMNENGIKDYEITSNIISFKTRYVLETNRLRLRRYEYSDMENLYEILSDEETMKYYVKPYDMNGTKRWIDWNINNYQSLGFGLWAIELKEDGRFIGDCGVTMQNIDSNIVPEIGFHINKKYWNKGYASEASMKVKEYFFNTTEFLSLYCYQTSNNTASRRVAEKIGMKLNKLYIDVDGIEVSVYQISK